jgi:hypothetical protein
MVVIPDIKQVNDLKRNTIQQDWVIRWTDEGVKG